MKAIEIEHLRSNAGLGADSGHDALCRGHLGKFFRLFKTIAQRPFAMHMLACGNGLADQFEMMRHFHRHYHEVDIGRRHQIIGAGERVLQAQRIPGALGTVQRGVGDADDLEAIGQAAQRRKVGGCRPVRIGIETDKANADRILRHCDVLN